MQPATTVCGLPFYKNPRDGQRNVIETAAEDGRTQLTVQLPTGYGKTFTAMGVFRVLQSKGVVNRCLYVVPRDRLLSQIVEDGTTELIDTGYDGPHCIKDIAFHEAACIKAHRMNQCAVFATTIQSLQIGTRVPVLVGELMSQGSWMVVIDEYQFYGEDNKWGPCARRLNKQFLLAMSATPYRDKNDSAFGEPEVVVRYSSAVDEQAVKPLELHSYVYRIDAISKDGSVKTYTTDELIAEAGGDDPEAIEKLKVKKDMRWSPKYVSPLISEPIMRMESERIRTGRKLQAIVFAMSCSHAELVCEQLKAMHPHLSIDWVGTGSNGRTDEENKAILNSFCPPKKYGERVESDIGIDVLVNVGLAGIGLDCNFVSEVVFPRSSNKNQAWCQAVGRGSRYLEDVTTFISVDSSSEWACYAGQVINEAIDDFTAKGLSQEELEELKEKEERDWLESYDSLPDEPRIHIHDMECIRIDKGGVDMMAKVIVDGTRGWSRDDLGSDEVQQAAETMFRKMREREAEIHNAKAIVKQWDDKVEEALSKVTGLCIRLMRNTGTRFDRSLVGDIKKRLNGRKKMTLGEKRNDVQTLRTHYQWIRDVERTILTEGIPTWLA